MAALSKEWNRISRTGPKALWMDGRVEPDGFLIVRQGYTRICVGYPLPEQSSVFEQP